jgi:hypothetical protein
MYAWLYSLDWLGIGAYAHNAFETWCALKRVNCDVLACVGVAFNTHGFAMHFDELPDTVLGFWDECELHGYAPLT